MKTILILFLTHTYLVTCESICKEFETCSDCIGYAHVKCVWCSARNHNDSRCQSFEFVEKNNNWCEEPYYNPSQVINFIQDDKFNAGQDGTKVVQFRPQRVQVKARPGTVINITMSYKPAVDYPLDVYYLMDYSFSMSAHAKELMEQAEKIYQGLTSLTNNVLLGAGSFVEKPAMPYANLGEHIAYSFKHHLSLTKDALLFKKYLSMPNGSNYDDPEAGFDALMQAMVCKKEIGWRDNARRIIVFCTDAVSHSAGDGKFAGAYQPNDMKCHLENNTYTMELINDYPSVSQINKIASEKNFKIIFSVDDKVKLAYEALVSKIRGSKYVPLKGLKGNDSYVVDMIKKEYLELVRTAKIESTVSNYVQLIKLEPDCKKNDMCTIKHEQSLNVTASFKITSCPEKREDRKFILNIGPVSLDEKLSIDVEIDCHCDCEKDGVKNSSDCSGHGTFQCGVCECNDGRYGSNCDCVGNESKASISDKCKANNDDINVCSGRGICRCGKCEECNEGFSGNFCQFDDTACPRPGGILCAGHGRCRFGKCECDANWMGDDCRCPRDEQMCMAPISNKVCSGRGTCVCGKCVCDKQTDEADMCSGKFCDDCDEFILKRCKELENYALCNFNSRTNTDGKELCDKEYNQTTTGVSFLNKTDMNAIDGEYKAKWCQKPIENDKILIFLYYYPPASMNVLEVVIQSDLDVIPEANVWVAVGSAIGGVLLIGLLMVIGWKILIDIHDKREYEKLEKDAAAAGFDIADNPLYRQPEVQFNNPAYRGNM